MQKIYFQSLSNVRRYIELLRYRQNSKFRRFLSPSLIKTINQKRNLLSGLKKIYVPVIHKSSNINIYHCTVHKTGSTWIRSLLSDLMTYRYSGLSHYHYQSMLYNGSDPRAVSERSFTKPFPGGKIISPLYIDYNNFKNIPKLGPYKAFFVMRDPRDITVSWYFSTKKIHTVMGEKILYNRNKLNELSLLNGIIYAIEFLASDGRFATMQSWAEAADHDPNVILVRYEDLSSDPTVVKQLFYGLDIRMPENVMEDLIRAYSFGRLSGRARGQEDERSHLRSGIAGDWRNHFDHAIEAKFYELTGNLIESLGYA